MAKFEKLSAQVPHDVRERLVNHDHGHKQLACTAGLIWYFNADEQTQRVYREWARGIAEGYASIETPPDTVAAVLKQRDADTGRGVKKR